MCSLLVAFILYLPISPFIIFFVGGHYPFHVRWSGVLVGVPDRIHIGWCPETGKVDGVLRRLQKLLCCRVSLIQSLPGS